MTHPNDPWTAGAPAASTPSAPASPWRRRLLQGAAALALPGVVRGGRAAPGDPFALGVASGQPRADRLVLWTRLLGEALPPSVPVRWVLAHDEGFRRIAARGIEVAVAGEAHSVHAEPGSLAPGRPYWYRFEALGHRSAVGRTRTAPAPDAAATLDFAIASCQRYDHSHYAAWRDVVAGEPDLVLFLGDYIYENASPAGALRPHDGGHARTLEAYRARYAQYRSDPALQAAHAAAPWLVVWDDHEVENDYAGLQGPFLQPGFARQRGAAYRAWWEHMPVPRAARPAGPDLRIHGRLDWGRLARLHLLDTRQWRDPQACPRPGRGGANLVIGPECEALADPRRSLLGESQERWLAAGWDRSRPWNLVAQQTLVAPFNRPGEDGRELVWTDGWDGYPHARRRLLEGMARGGARNVVLLGGDVHAHHVAALHADPADARSPVLASEFCGTSIASHGPGHARLDAARAANPHVLLARGDRRGSVRFRLDAQALRAELRGVLDARDPASAAETLARFAVEAGRPGPQPA